MLLNGMACGCLPVLPQKGSLKTTSSHLQASENHVNCSSLRPPPVLDLGVQLVGALDELRQLPGRNQTVKVASAHLFVKEQAMGPWVRHGKTKGACPSCALHQSQPCPDHCRREQSQPHPSSLYPLCGNTCQQRAPYPLIKAIYLDTKQA